MKIKISYNYEHYKMFEMQIKVFMEKTQIMNENSFKINFKNFNEQ